MFIIDQLVHKLNDTGIATKLIPSRDSYVLTHNKTPEEFHTAILSIMRDIDLTPQDAAWLPGDPCNVGEGSDSYGYYVYGKEYDEEGFDEIDIFISNTEVQWV
jgi:hypothetical protein